MDWRDALLILQLPLEDRFLQIWISLPAERDVRQPLRRPHKRVYFRTSVKDQLQAQATGQGIRQIFRLNNLEAARSNYTIPHLTPASNSRGPGCTPPTARLMAG